jgi:anti-sigma regulatory factor (Ser/Thr protein kinase)
MWYAVDITAPASARSYANWFLGRCNNVPNGVAEDAELAVSEMVTNAHTATLNLSGPTEICLSLRLFTEHLLIEVIDSSPEPPILKRIDANAVNGRGLHLVDSLSSEWGFFMHRNRKVVYCILPVPMPGQKP